jgi:hypothetical protein
MRKHNGMRPQDVVILLKIAALKNNPWRVIELAAELSISQSEISESLFRSTMANLLADNKKMLMKNNLIDFLTYGLPYVFPVQPGGIVRGLVTGHSAAPLNSHFRSNENFVWPWDKGVNRGQSIQPLHPSVPRACLLDPKLHELLALTDALRTGKVREQDIAIKELKRLI